MEQNSKQLTKYLFITEGVGLVFVAVFLAAYLGGLPGTAVLHSELAFRLPLAIFGTALLVLALYALVLSAMRNRRQ